jgi:hypothetical protein
VFLADAFRAYWFDQDSSRLRERGIFDRSAHAFAGFLGHHILRFSKSDILPGLQNSCNLNELAGRIYQTFSEKHPLGTVHFLLWLYHLEIPNRPWADLLIWLADSAYINGQSQYWTRARGLARGYRWNVKHWLEKEIPVRSLLETFQQIDTREFECQMQAFQQAMNQREFPRGYGQAASRHLRLSGYQCQPNPGNIASDIRQLLGFVAEITGWTSVARVKWLSLDSGRSKNAEHGKRWTCDRFVGSDWEDFSNRKKYFLTSCKARGR